MCSHSNCRPILAPRFFIRSTSTFPTLLVLAALVFTCQATSLSAQQASDPTEPKTSIDPTSSNDTQAGSSNNQGAITDDEDDTQSSAADAKEVTFKQQVTEAIIKRTNTFRQENDLPALNSDASLTKAARKFASFMAVEDRYGHNADGRTPAERAKEAGYKYCVVRENIAYRKNPVDPSRESLTDTFVQGWIDSSSHRDNMLADYVTETGVAVATDDGVTFYAVQLFGRPRTAAIQIEITQRSQEPVTLVIESRDSRDEISLEPRMRLRMTRCFPTTFSLKESESTLTLRENADLVIESGELKRQDNVTDQSSSR